MSYLHLSTNQIHFFSYFFEKQIFFWKSRRVSWFGTKNNNATIDTPSSSDGGKRKTYQKSPLILPEQKKKKN